MKMLDVLLIDLLKEANIVGINPFAFIIQSVKLNQD